MDQVERIPVKICKEKPYNFMVNSEESLLFVNTSYPNMDSEENLVQTLEKMIYSFLERKSVKTQVGIFAPQHYIDEIVRLFKQRKKTVPITFTQKDCSLIICNNSTCVTLIPFTQDALRKNVNSFNFIWLLVLDRDSERIALENLSLIEKIEEKRCRLVVNIPQFGKIPRDIFMKFDEVIKS